MRVITAIGTPYINDRLRENNKIEIVGKDIQYQDGIIEILEDNKDIDILVLSNILPGEYEFISLIDKIKNINKTIEIIVFFERKDTDAENLLNCREIYKIYILNEHDISMFLKNFMQDKKEHAMLTEVRELKDLILYKSSGKNYENLIQKRRKTIDKKISLPKINFKIKPQMSKTKVKYEKKNIETKIIVITGAHGSGKSVISSMLSQYIQNQNKKTLLIDFDIFNNSIKTMFGIKPVALKTSIENMEAAIINISSNLSILHQNNIETTENVEHYKIIEFLNRMKNLYDFIIIDTSSETEFKYVKLVVSTADKIIFLIEPNLSEIKKSKNLLEIFINDFDTDIDKIKIVFNKVNKYKISEIVLQEIFSNFEIISELKYDEKYSLYINKNRFEISDEYKKIYEKISV